MPVIQFFGAAGTVTGSKYLLEYKDQRLLLDCGLFQGAKELRQRNWRTLSVKPASIDAVILSHAHIDHTGYLPRLVKDGFRGPVYATPATRDLLAIMLPDSGRIQEEDARYANRKKYSRHNPALPLYTEADASKCIPMIQACPYEKPKRVTKDITVTLFRAGHILGSAIVVVDLGTDHRVVFSGDLGRYDTPILCDPTPIKRATTLLVESTYADRKHKDEKPETKLLTELQKMIDQRRFLIIPAFAIGRTQYLLYLMRELQDKHGLPDFSVFVDSPMACDATPLFLMHRDEHDDGMSNLVLRGSKPLHPRRVQFTRSVTDSRAIHEVTGPAVIVSASGMATGGRVLHHLKRRLPSSNTTVLFIGYQAYGTRGRKLLDGAQRIRIHGQDIVVRARIGQIYGFSGHADYIDVDRWRSSLQEPPEQTFCIHGEEKSLAAAVLRFRKRGFRAYAPGHEERIKL